MSLSELQQLSIEVIATALVCGFLFALFIALFGHEK
jgi:hypothetical protein